MDGPRRAEIKVGSVVEDVYRCKVNTCGRMYSPTIGHFNEAGSGKGSRLRTVLCNSADQTPMYIKSIHRGGMPNQDMGVFKCPECSQEREEPIPSIPVGR